MSSDFTTCLVKDARLSGITDQLTYAVQSGASSNTYQEFNAIGPSNSQLAFNVQVPSENVIVSREVFIKATIQFTVAIKPGVLATGNTAAVNAVTPNSGGRGGFAFNAFPLNQLFTTTTAQINNTNVSANNQDILPILLQLADQHDLYTYDDTTAVCVDRVVSKYSDVPINSPINPLGNMWGADPDGVKRGRGISQLKVMKVCRYNAPAAVGATTGATDSFDYSGTTNDTNTFYLNCEAELIEPLIGLSPFTYGNNQFNKAGLVGINSFNLVCNIDGQISRLIGSSSVNDVDVTPGWDNRGANGSGSSTTALFVKASLLVNFLSSQPTDLIPARNIVPYVDLPRYITSSLGTIPAAAYEATAGGSQRIEKTTKEFESTNIQINQMPDYFIVAARVTPTFSEFYPSQKAMKNAPSFLAINSISINLNNTSGLLSSCSSTELYRMSVANHSNQTFTAWNGVYTAGTNSGFSIVGSATTTFPAVNTLTACVEVPGLPKEYPSVGSVLVLNPAKDLSLPDYLSSGSLGSFNFQFRLNCSNYHVSTNPVPVELIVIAVNSGIFTTIAGSSNIFTGLLTKAMVLDAKKDGAEDPINAVQYERLAGGQMVPNSSAKEMSVVKDYKKMKGMGVRSGGGVSGGAKADRFAHLMT
jgi:hypothetical protein